MRNTNMRRGFTMIELIFVIVIIGILAAVAIPKLSATRDDAKVSNIIANTRTLVGDLGAYYTAQGTGGWDNNASITVATNVDILGPSCAALDANSTKISPNTFTLCDGGVDSNPCVQFVTASGGQLTISNVTGATGICASVQADPAVSGLIGSQNFGGSRVTR